MLELTSRLMIEWGIPFDWNYVWANECWITLNPEQVEKLTEPHKTISKHTIDIVKRWRQEVLDEGIYRDYIPSTRSSLPDGGGGRDDGDVSGSAPVAHAGSPTLAALGTPAADCNEMGVRKGAPVICS